MEELYQLFPFTGYKVRRIRLEEMQESPLRVFLERLDTKPLQCHKCGCPMRHVRGRQRRTFEDLRMADRRTYIHFSQFKGRCTQCRKVGSKWLTFCLMRHPI